MGSFSVCFGCIQRHLQYDWLVTLATGNKRTMEKEKAWVASVLGYGDVVLQSTRYIVWIIIREAR